MNNKSMLWNVILKFIFEKIFHYFLDIEEKQT